MPEGENLTKMQKQTREKIEALTKEKKMLPDCPRRRDIEAEIEKLKRSLKKNPGDQPEIIVRYSGAIVGEIIYDETESSYIFKSNDGSKTEIGFLYDDVRGWASVRGFQLKVEMP